MRVTDVQERERVRCGLRFLAFGNGKVGIQFVGNVFHRVRQCDVLNAAIISDLCEVPLDLASDCRHGIILRHLLKGLVPVQCGKGGIDFACRLLHRVTCCYLRRHSYCGLITSRNWRASNRHTQLPFTLAYMPRSLDAPSYVTVSKPP